MIDHARYRRSVKAARSDELLNTYLLRPMAGLIVWSLIPLRVTPNQVTVVSILTGFVAASLYLPEVEGPLVLAGLLVTVKDVLDSVDGQLARATGRFSRAGRFLDSIGDFAVNVALFGAIGWRLWHDHQQQPWWLLAALVGFLGTTLRISYHVFYQVSYLHLEGEYTNNRVTEEITEQDLNEGPQTLMLHRWFLALYGWQDRVLLHLDAWCGRDLLKRETQEEWYSDPVALRLSSFLGIATELFLLMLWTVFNSLETYLMIVNLGAMNILLAFCVWHRRVVLRRILAR
jgi:phosphatidylglycerophosphate synthase